MNKDDLNIELKPLREEVTRIEQQLLDIRNKLTGYDGVLNNHSTFLTDFGKRIAVLEEARQRQVHLNQVLSEELDDIIAPKSSPEAKFALKHEGIPAEATTSSPTWQNHPPKPPFKWFWQK